MAVVLAAHLDRAFSDLRERHASATAAPEDAAVVEHVVARRTAQALCRDLADLARRIRGRRMVGPGVCVHRLTTRLHRAARHATARVTPNDLYLVPVETEDLRGRAGRIRDRMRAEITDALVHVQFAVRANDHEAVESARARRVR